MRALSLIASIVIWSFASGLLNASGRLEYPSSPSLDFSHLVNVAWNYNRSRICRVEFGMSSTTVFSYPSGSKKVLVVPYCSGVDLDFLEHTRFKSAE